MKKILFLFMFCFTLMSKAQYFENICLKTGAGPAMQNKSPELAIDHNDALTGMLAGFEAEIFRFGKQKNMAISLDAFYAQKGGTNSSYIYTFDANGQPFASGNMSYLSRINYISLSPVFKYGFAKFLYLKAGPRVDLYSSHDFSQLPPNTKAPEANYSFESACYGLSYAFGAVFGQGAFRFMTELMGQNDLSISAKNSNSGQSYTNNLYTLNVGLVYRLKSDSD